VKILVYPHDLNIGGSQINAIDLAAAAVEAGNEVLVYGVEGPLVEYIEKKGLRYVPARALRYRPAPSRIAQLGALARRERIDLIHAYEWPPCLDAYYGAHVLGRVPLLCTVLSMSVSPLVPRTVPLVMGTEALGDEARGSHDAAVWVMEPPIDVVGDHPNIDGRAFRRAHHVDDSEVLIVSVSRFAIDLKLDALTRAIDAIDTLAERHPVRLVMVGGGEAHQPLLQRAAAVNARHGRRIVDLPGPDPEPRPAYAAADIVVGMGSSALRGMAIGKPVVVQGERGFSRLFEPDTVDLFLWQGFWGVGADPPGVELLTSQLEPLVANPARRAELGAFGRHTACERFSLARATESLLSMYEQIRSTPFRLAPSLAEAARRGLSAVRLEATLHDPRRKRTRAATAHRRLEVARQSTHGPAPVTKELP
jgi:glycosyltransferase involved in cell wall biosynthesis